jgi:transporter family protein
VYIPAVRFLLDMELSSIPWWGYALGTMAMFGVTNSLLKFAAHEKMDSIFASQILWLSVGIFGLIFFAYYYSTGTFTTNLTGTSSLLLAVPVIAGVCLAAGMFLIKKAVAAGPAGPATAISAGNAILVTLFAYVVLKEGLSMPKVIGMIMVVAGIIVMSVFV